MVSSQFSFTSAEQKLLKRKAVHWAAQHSHFSWLSDNEIAYPQGGFPQVLAVGLQEAMPYTSTPHFWQQLAQWQAQKRWVFGYFGYDLKNTVENLHSHNPDHKQWPTYFLYEPKHVLLFDTERVVIHSEEPEVVWLAIQTQVLPEEITHWPSVTWEAQTSREGYIAAVENLQQHIVEGDIYEVNYCMEFVADLPEVSPLAVFERLNALSPMPFAALHKQENQWLVCASPERFLKKTGDKLLSQPIKGTAPRGKTPSEDEEIKYNLLHNEKERAENLMIVDLVRNDLARNAVVGSTRVPELFGIYSFQYVHQMISSVAATLQPNCPWTTALRDAFPMGSMTGAPKIRAMQLIEQYEDTKRGVYSGALGYIAPNADFDFNVVIRSLFLDTQRRRMSFQVGSAITHDAAAAAEYEECLLKAQAIFRVFR